MSAQPLILIVGPTAVGKTEVAIGLAQALGGEIVSADSRQVYRGMDIGTAKPTPQERALVPHHLVDVVDPDQTLTLAQYQELGREAIDDIAARGKVPFVVGGTGLYVRAVAEGWTVPRVAPNPALRAELVGRAEREGAASLYAELQALDPQAAARIDARNVRRVVRALEVWYETGQTFTELQGRVAPPYDELWVGLTMPRETLYARADARIDQMIARGWVQEVEDLVDRGCSLEAPAFSALGYREIVRHLQGDLQLDEAVALIKRHTRRFIRHQYAWFSPADPRIHWFDVSRPQTGAACDLAAAFLQREA